MAYFCTNCGKELKPNADVCLNCGHLVYKNEVVNTYTSDANADNGGMVGVLSIIFGVLGFYPLTIIGSIIGIVLGLIGLTSTSKINKKRSKIGLWVSSSTFLVWVILIVVIAIYTRNDISYYGSLR